MISQIWIGAKMHGASGYFLDQFSQTCMNMKRNWDTGVSGGSEFPIHLPVQAPVADPGFHRRGKPTPTGPLTYYLSKISRKLHENEELGLGGGSGGVPGVHLGSANGSCAICPVRKHTEGRNFTSLLYLLSAMDEAKLVFDYKAVVSYTGKVIYIPHMKVSVLCRLKLKRFPYDLHPSHESICTLPTQVETISIWYSNLWV